MPDESAECQIILNCLHAIEAQNKALAQYFSEELDGIKATLAEMREERAEERGRFGALQWGLARLGATVLLGLSMIGWLASGENWQNIKNLFR